MIQIRNYQESDLDFVREHNFLLSLQIPYCSDFDTKNVLTAENGNGEVVGVAVLAYHSTWYSEVEDAQHKLVLDYVQDDTEKEVFPALLAKVKEQFHTIVKESGKKNCSIVCWFDSNEIEETQKFLRNEFVITQDIPVLKYSLEKEIPSYEIPEGITVERLELTDENVNAYVAASAKADPEDPNSKGELLFNAGGDSFQIYVTKEGDQILSAISLWNIGDGHCATENIFTIPEYRHRNLARIVITKGLQVCKDAGQTIATLSMSGSNRNAMRLYQSL